MSVKASSWARGLTEFKTKNDKVVLMILAERASNEGQECWPSMRLLALECIATQRTIKTRIHNLIAQGYVTRLQRGTRHQKSVYRLNVEGLPPDGQDDSPPNLPLTLEEMAQFDADAEQFHLENSDFQGENNDFQGENSDFQGENNDFQGESFVSSNLPVEPYKRTGSRTGDKATTAADNVTGFSQNLAAAYLANVGPVTPMLLAEFERFAANHDPPETWGEQAVVEAVEHNVLKWTYIRAVLLRWCEESNDEVKTKEAEPSHRGVEVRPGEFWFGNYKPYTDPDSPFYAEYKGDDS